MNGWQLVPVEPTMEMLEASFKVTMSMAAHKWHYRELVYKEMLSAAPTPEPDEDEIGIPPGKDIPVPPVPQPEPTVPTELLNAADDVMYVIKLWQENRTITFVPSEERIFQRFDGDARSQL